MAANSQPAAQAQTFTVQKLDTIPPDTGLNCSLALTSTFDPLVACWQNIEAPEARLVLLSQSTDAAHAGAFVAEQVTGGPGAACALAVDPSGRPWVACYDLANRSVQVLHRDTQWTAEVVDSGLSSFAVAGIGLAIGSDGLPRVAWSTAEGLGFATRSPITGGWQRDVFGASEWRREVIAGGKLTAGWDIRVNGSATFSQAPDALQIIYGAGQTSASVLVTFGPAAPSPTRPGTDVSAYASLMIEMRGDAGQTIEIAINDRNHSDDNPQTTVPLTLTADWSTYTVPLTKFTGVDITQLHVVTDFVFRGPLTHTVFVRGVRFSDVSTADVVVTPGDSPTLPASPAAEIAFLIGSALGSGLGLAVNTSTSRHDWTSADGNALKLAYPGDPVFGSASITFGPPVDKNRPGADLSAFSTLLVEMRGDPGKTVQVGIKDKTQPDNGSEVTVRVTLTADWRTYAIPLSIFSQGAPKANLHQVFDIVEFVFAGAQPITAFVRDVRYSAAPAGSINPLPPLTDGTPIYPSLALGPRDVPSIAYFDADAQRLRLAQRCEQFKVAADGSMAPVRRWQVIEITDRAGDRFAGEFTSAKVDPAGVVHLGWWTLSGPRYARQEGRLPVSVEAIESAPGVGMYVSLDVDRSGQPQALYYDSVRGDLRLARRTNDQWTSGTMDSDGDVGGFASLALDPLARQRAAYYDWNAGAVRLAALDVPVVAHKSFETVTSGLRSANIIVRVDSSAASLVEVVLQKKAGNQFVPATSDPPPLLASPGLPADPVLLGPGPFRIALRTRLSHLVLGFSEQFDFPPPDTVFNGQKRPQDVVLSGTIQSLDAILAAS